MENILTAATVIVPVVLAATGLVKKVVVNDNKWLPAINLVIGILLGVVYAATIVGGDYELYGWAGFISGLAAGGFYDLGANGKGLINQKKATALIDSGEGDQDMNEDGDA